MFLWRLWGRWCKEKSELEGEFYREEIKLFFGEILELRENICVVLNYKVYGFL